MKRSVFIVLVVCLAAVLFVSGDRVCHIAVSSYLAPLCRAVPSVASFPVWEKLFSKKLIKKFEPQIVHVYLTADNNYSLGNKIKMLKVVRRLSEKLGERFSIVLIVPESKLELLRDVSAGREVSDVSHNVPKPLMLAEEKLYKYPSYSKPSYVVMVGDEPFVASWNMRKRGNLGDDDEVAADSVVAVVDRSGIKKCIWLSIFNAYDRTVEKMRVAAEKLYGIAVDYYPTGFGAHSMGILTEKINREELMQIEREDDEIFADRKNNLLHGLFSDTHGRYKADSCADILTALSKRPWAFTYTRGDYVPTPGTKYTLTGLPVYLQYLYSASSKRREPFFMCFLLHRALKGVSVSRDILNVFFQTAIEFSVLNDKPLKLLLWDPDVNNPLTDRFAVDIKHASRQDDAPAYRERLESSKRIYSPNTVITPECRSYRIQRGKAEIIVLFGEMPSGLLKRLDLYNVVLLQPSTLKYDQIGKMLNISAHCDSAGKATEYWILGTGDNFLTEALLRGINVVADGNQGSQKCVCQDGLYDLMRIYALSINSDLDTLDKIEVLRGLAAQVANPAFYTPVRDFGKMFSTLSADSGWNWFLHDFGMFLEKYNALDRVAADILKRDGLDDEINTAA